MPLPDNKHILRAIIVDDEKHSRDGLQFLLEKHCPEVTVVAACGNSADALEAIDRHQPQLLFLDVEMPGRDGFELLEACNAPRFAVIFTTAYDHYAMQAIRHSALDYLLKPIDVAELQAAVTKAASQQGRTNEKKVEELISFLHQHLQQGERLALPTPMGLRMMVVKDIIRCESDGAATYVYVQHENKPVMVSRTLKEMEELLKDKGFFRVHHSYLVNLSFMDKYIKGDGGEIIMSDGQRVPVSRQKKQDFLLRIEKL